MDARVFQIDGEFFEYRENMACAREDLSRYYGAAGLPPDLAEAVCTAIVTQLTAEYPAFFRQSENTLECELTGEILRFDEHMGLDATSDRDYVSSLDALACQVQEDLAVVQMDASGADRLVAVHVTAPSYWDPAEKLGGNFMQVHAPVPGMEGIYRKAGPMLRALAAGARYQRFAWAITTDRRLNHHPTTPSRFAGEAGDWYGRAFDPTAPSLYVRIERQTIVGLAEANAFLFTIRPHFLDCTTMPRELRMKLVSALGTMSAESRVYKGIADRFNDIVLWLSRDF